MKTRLTFLIVIFINISVLVYGNIYIVDTSKLPDDEAFNINMETLLSINDYVNHYSPEWRYPVDKGQLITFLTEFHDDIKNNNDYEVKLLDVVIMSYLYNLDQNEYYSVINEKVSRMKQDRPGDYRSYWFLGNFLVSAAKAMDGYNEFVQIQTRFNKRPEEYSAYFINDLALACLMVQMYENALYYFDLAAGMSGSPAANTVHANLRNSFRDASAGNEYPRNSVWQVMKSNDRFYLLSRMLGSLIPINPSWDMRVMGLNDRKSLLIITPERLTSANNRAIGITILIEYNLTGVSYENYLRDNISRYPVVSREKRTINNHEYDVLVYEDKTKYTNMGGARGYIILTQLRFNNQNNTSIELPFEMNTSGGSGVNYYSLNNIFHRINQNINICIMVDSSNEIFNEASNYIFNLLNRMVLE